MEIRLAKGAGFCFGVKRAIRLTYVVLEKAEGPVYTLGPLIHNPQVVRELESKGIRVVEDLDKIHSGILILRSHGVPLTLHRKAVRRGLKVVDAICPRVKRVQRLALRLKREGHRVVLIGEADHPEVTSILESVGAADVLESNDSVNLLPRVKRMGVIAQTTQEMGHFRRMVAALIEKADELRIYNTICEASIRMQKESMNLARGVDIMIVVGGYNSANTRRLVEVCRPIVDTYHIEEAREIDKDWLAGKERIGVTAGASTPPWIIDEVLESLRSYPGLSG